MNQAPNGDGRTEACFSKKVYLHVWVGSTKLAEWTKTQFGKNNSFELVLHTAHESYLASMSTKRCLLKKGSKRDRLADTKESDEASSEGNCQRKKLKRAVLPHELRQQTHWETVERIHRNAKAAKAKLQALPSSKEKAGKKKVAPSMSSSASKETTEVPSRPPRQAKLDASEKQKAIKRKDREHLKLEHSVAASKRLPMIPRGH